MKQKRFQRCFICHNPETLLVRYLLATRIKKNQVDLHKKYKDKRQHIKTLFMRTADFEKKTITQTYMFICVNTSCWRFCNYENLKEEWDIKNWREKKTIIITPNPAIIYIRHQLKVGELNNQNNEKRKRSIVQAVQVEPEESKARRPHESRVQAEVGGQGMACYA